VQHVSFVPVIAMLNRIENPDFVDTETALIEACPQAAVLIEALRDCRHPRAARLTARLRHCEDPGQIEILRSEVFSLLAMSFGREEAERRLASEIER